jgi:hypothetical protein
VWPHHLGVGNIVVERGHAARHQGELQTVKQLQPRHEVAHHPFDAAKAAEVRAQN